MVLNPARLDSWAREIIVDPLAKGPLIEDRSNNRYLSPYGRQYPITNGVLDLRLLNNHTTPDQTRWSRGQSEYEEWSRSLIAGDHLKNYQSEIEQVREVYADMPVVGKCLDVGGHQGRLRQFLSAGQPYISCDPFIDVFADLEKQPNLLEAFPFLAEPVNFVCCDAEFLPFQSVAFDTVHMRSVIDHLLSPELALNEAYRVLGGGGVLIVGLWVKGKPGTRARHDAKSLAREMLARAGVRRFVDHHVWHPTYAELIRLIRECGFEIDRVHWQKGHEDNVCYIRAIKSDGLIRGLVR
ncbi:MAG: methyltransferase domain-containing protein [Candidatus Eisenbacteria bacterium]|uniref:Methyltransferase domain-containing protein n=1 Tax=Eiseniibacteriota bacterium TaxID=2212470 RepID=A0A9D6LBH3_UNCEI|nr:methyltransferase domain-containing protein [Candidatus Eisenbacteria bacterium]